MAIYISYTLHDKPAANQLARQFRKANFAIHFERKVPGRHISWDLVYEAIKRSDVFIFVLSPSSLLSFTCRLEYTYADNLNKRIVPIMVEDVNPETMPEALKQIDLVDYATMGKRASDLSRLLSSLPAPKNLPQPMPAHPPPLAAISNLRQQVLSLPNQIAAQRTLVYQLSEFLGRTETAEDAAYLLRFIQDHGHTDKQVVSEINRTFKRSRTLVNRWRALNRQGRILAVLLVGVILIGIATFGSLSIRNAINPEPTSISAIALSTSVVTSTSMPESQPTEEIDEVFITMTALVDQITGTALAANNAQPTATDDIALTTTAAFEEIIATANAAVTTPTVSASETPLPSATFTATATATNTPIPTNTPQPSATSTATATNTLVPSSTPTQTPTNTLLPPTNTTIPPSQTPDPQLTRAANIQRATETARALPTATSLPSINVPPSATPSINSLPMPMYMGIMVEDSPQGVRVVDLSDSAAEAGIQIGDLVIAVDVQRVFTVADFAAQFKELRAFSEVSFWLRRNNENVAMRMTLNPLDFAFPTEAADSQS